MFPCSFSYSFILSFTNVCNRLLTLLFSASAIALNLLYSSSFITAFNCGLLDGIYIFPFKKRLTTLYNFGIIIIGSTKCTTYCRFGCCVCIGNTQMLFNRTRTYMHSALCSYNRSRLILPEYRVKRKRTLTT